MIRKSGYRLSEKIMLIHLSRPGNLANRGVVHFLHTRKSAMTFMVAARTSTQRAAFDTVSIVPSIRMAWTTTPATMTTASDI